MMSLIETVLERLFLSFILFLVCIVVTAFLGSMLIAVWNITAFALDFTSGVYTSKGVIKKVYAITFVAFYFPSLVYIFTRSKQSVSDFVFGVMNGN